VQVIADHSRQRRRSTEFISFSNGNIFKREWIFPLQSNFFSITLFASCRSVSNDKMQKFFKNDFSQERWRKAALKNAYALLGLQRFHHAAAFFLLAGGLKDAIDVSSHHYNNDQCTR